MRSMIGLSLVLAACGSPTPVSGDVTAPRAASAPVAAANLATGIEVGLVYSANLMGELEPCG